MNITYAYNPALHDLYLYENYTTPLGMSVKRPIAYNPTSWLYGYRYSLEGLMATNRTFSIKRTSEFNFSWLPYNADIPANLPAFANSWPPPMRVIHPNVSLACGHSIGVPTTQDRNPIQTMAQWGYPSLLDQCSWRFIKGDDTPIDISTSRLSKPYYLDGGSNLSSLDSVSVPLYTDNALIELLDPFPGNALKLIDSTTIEYGRKCWLIDGSQKIIEIYHTGSFKNQGFGPFPTVFFNSLVGVNTPPYSGLGTHGVGFRINANDGPFPLFTHDSGSVVVAEIKPPSSSAAGDGVLGTITGTVSISPHLGLSNAYMYVDLSDFIYQNPQETFYSPMQTSRNDQSIPEVASTTAYWASRGWQYPAYYAATNVNLADSTITANIATTVQGFMNNVV